MRSDLELGISAWAHDHVSLCLRNQAMKIDVSLPDGATDFLALMGLDRQAMEEAGRQVRLDGCASQYAESLQQLSTGYTHWLFSPLDDGWRRHEGSMPRNSTDEDSRFRKGPPWSRKSCAIDCALFLATQMNVGRIQADVILLPRLMTLTIPAFVLRYLISLPLGTYSDQQWAGMRDILRRATVDAGSGHYSMDKESAFASMFQDLLEGLPQVSWHTVTGEWCCDSKPTTCSKNPRSHNHVTVTTSGDVTTVQGALDAMMLKTQRKSCEVPCSAGQQCAKMVDMVRQTVVDRMPPRLIICFAPELKTELCQSSGVFDDLEVRYVSLAGGKTQKYRAVGAVYGIANDHFTCRWQPSKGQVLDYDLGQVKGVPSLEQRARRNLYINTMIYERV